MAKSVLSDDDFVGEAPPPGASDHKYAKDQFADISARVAAYTADVEKGLHMDDDFIEQDRIQKRGKPSARIAKIDEALGLVFGYAIVCNKDGKPYYDLNIDKKSDGSYKRVPEHIPEDAMLKAAVDFAQSARMGNEMHGGPATGEYVFVFPMTSDIAKAFGVHTQTTGLMVAYKPSPEVFAKFKDGTYTGFSIEGSRIKSAETE